MNDALIMATLALSLERDKAIGLSNASKFSQAVLAYRHKQARTQTSIYTQAIICKAVMQAAKQGLFDLRNAWAKGDVTDEAEIEQRANKLLNIANLAALELEQLEQTSV